LSLDTYFAVEALPDGRVRIFFDPRDPRHDLDEPVREITAEIVSLQPPTAWIGDELWVLEPA
jgi:hypothetical protein